MRLAGGSKPVYAFAWSYFHNGTTPLTTTDLQASLSLPFYSGADGVVIWGDPRGAKVSPRQGGGAHVQAADHAALLFVGHRGNSTQVVLLSSPLQTQLGVGSKAAAGVFVRQSHASALYGG